MTPLLAQTATTAAEAVASQAAAAGEPAGLHWPSVLFLLFAAIACSGAVLVVLTSHVARMAMHLVVSLSATAALFFLAGADFVGAMQLMIYVGGTLVLLVFGVMLTAQERFMRMRTPFSERVLAGLLGAGLLILLVSAAWNVPGWRGGDAARGPDEPTSTIGPLAMALVGVRVDSVRPDAAGYLLPFELVSVHLLVVLVGAAYLARTRLAGSLVAPGGGAEEAIATAVDDCPDPVPSLLKDTAERANDGGESA